MSFDEVPKANSSNCNYWVASVSFVPCGVAYPFRIVEKHTKRDKSDVHSLYCPVVKEILDSGLQIRHILADSKERKRLMGLSSITAK